MNDETQNTENTPNTDTQEGNRFHDLVLKECETEILALDVTLRKALREENTDDICKVSEALARVKQNAMLVAANAQAILLRVISNQPQQHQASAEAVAKKFIAETKLSAVKNPQE